MRILALLVALSRAALDLVLPPLCACCDAAVAAPGQLCALCFGQLAFISEPACQRCGLPFSSPEAAGRTRICDSCTANPPPWQQARAALVYDDKAKSLILPLKHTDRGENAAVLALHMHRAGAALLARADVLVPVPLHRWRLLRRRYNQAAFLAHALGHRARRPVLADVLRRPHATTPLGGLNAAERVLALENAITTRPSRCAALSGRSILLIDDVLTTGATAAACARALLDAGASNVDVLVASRVPPPGSRTEPDQTHAED
jgi:ComF family protein